MADHDTNDHAAEAEASEDPEPVLKYQRLGASVTEILAADAASCLAVHAKFLALGTVAGAVHVLDLNGNEIRRFKPHSARVNGISIDRTGEFVGSCSEDGTVVISSLYGAAASTHWYHRPVSAMAFDPDYAAKRVFAAGGLAGQLIVNSKGWFGSKDAVLHSGEGAVHAIACCGPMLAWANELGAKVYDALHAKRVSYVARPAGSGPTGTAPSALLRCHLRWESETELLIGWVDEIRIGRVRTGSARAGGVGGTRAGDGTTLSLVGAGGAAAAGAAKYMEIVTLIQTDFYICGLGCVKLRQEEGVRKARVRVRDMARARAGLCAAAAGRKGAQQQG